MSTLNVMNRIVEVAGTAGRERRLPRGAFAEVAFTPAAGAISASAGVVTDPLGRVDPNPERTASTARSIPTSSSLGIWR